MRIPEAAVRLLLRARRANATFVSVEGARRAVERQGRRPGRSVPPKALRRDVRVTVAHEQDGSVYAVSPADGASSGGVVYVHGGGWVHEMAPQHWSLVAQIAAEACVEVAVPIYALLPRGDARRAHDLVLRVAHERIAQHGSVRLVGDSAGGQIALSVAQTLRDEGVPAVRTILIAPALDLTFTNPRIPEVQRTDPWLGQLGGQELGRLWAGDLPVEHPIVSPLFGELAGLGEILLLTGTRDVLNPDAQLLVAKARRAGVPVELRERPGSIHVYPLLPTASGRQARAEIVAALR